MRHTLKPCPFCGSDHVALRQPPHQNFVECLDCYASGNNLPTSEQAVAAWNRRAPDADLVDALEGLLDATKKEECDADCTSANCPWLYAREALRREKESEVGR